MDNIYWNNISELAAKQRDKGISTYGQGIEDNQLDTLTRILYIEEELIDALMYLEWLKDSLNSLKQGECANE